MTTVGIIAIIIQTLLIIVLAASGISYKINQQKEKKQLRKNEQAEKKADERKESINTGNSNNDFNASINVLHDIAKRGK